MLAVFIVITFAILIHHLIKYALPASKGFRTWSGDDVLWFAITISFIMMLTLVIPMIVEQKINN